MRILRGFFTISAVLVLTSVILTSVVLTSCGKKEQTAIAPLVPVRVEAVGAEEIRTTLRYSGAVQPDTEVQLAFKQPGYVAALHQVRGADGRLRDAQVGDEIPAGTVLARLRRSDYEATVNLAVGQERSVQGSLDASHAELEQAKADQTKADQDFRRAESLYAAKALIRPDYDAAAAHHAAATASVEAALRQIEARQGQLTAARAQMASARIGLDDTNLFVPMPSVIIARSVERGSLAAAGTPAFLVADTRVVKVEFGVPDNMVAHFRMGASVPVELEALPGRTLTGRITQIAASADRESRAFSIQVSLPNRDRLLKIGMIAGVRIEDADNRRTVPVVPATLLRFHNSRCRRKAVRTTAQCEGWRDDGQVRRD
jgi:multidrug efflux pump subunit AcrA (membrane-fusion protein)